MAEIADKDKIDLKSEAQKNSNPKEHRRMLKNVFVIALVYMILFTAALGVGNLQSSINAEAGLGNYSMSAFYGTFFLSSILLPTFLVQKCTVKWTMVFSIVGYIVYIAAQFYPTFSTLIPAAVAMGLLGAPFWCSAATYLTIIGHKYAVLIGDTSEAVITKFFGIWFMGFQTSQIWGNIISSTILTPGEVINANDSSIHKDISMCGSSFCPAHAQSGEVIEKPSETKIFALIAVYVGCAIAAVIVTVFFVDPLSRFGEREREGRSGKLTTCQLLLATFQQCLRPRQILMIPITFWSGYQQGFFTADYAQAYISCSWGVHHVGYILICYGVLDAIFCVGLTPIVRRTGRPIIFILATILSVGLIVTLFLWKPDPSAPVVFFVIAALWGVGDAVWQTQVKAFIAVLFPQYEEPAFSHIGIWESMGFLAAYLASNAACVSTKLWSQLIVLAISLVGYFTVEFLVRSEKKQEKKNSPPGLTMKPIVTK